MRPLPWLNQAQRVSSTHACVRPPGTGCAKPVVSEVEGTLGMARPFLLGVEQM